MSLDPPATQREFAQQLGIDFPLLSDADATISRAYGVYRSLLKVAKRVTFVIDPDGIVTARYHHELRIGRHLNAVMELLNAP